MTVFTVAIYMQNYTLTSKQLNNQNYGKEIFLRGITRNIRRTPY